jgi:hypothetical protein
MTRQDPFNPRAQRPPYPNPLSLGSSAAVTTEVRMRAMRGRMAASILGIFVAGGLIFEPVEASARGGAFAGSRAAPGFRAVIPHAFALPKPIVAPVRARAAPSAHIGHRRVPVAVWVPWSADYNDSTLVLPYGENLADSAPSPYTNVIPGRLGCTKQVYRVRSEEGGTRNVSVVRC